LDFATSFDLPGVLPETILVITTLLVIVLDAMRRDGWKSAVLPVVTGIGFVASAAAAMATWGYSNTVFAGTVFADGFASLFRALFAVIGLLTVLFSPYYLRTRNMRLGEYYSLLLIAVFGMMVMASAANLLLFFLGLEVMSIALYVLAAIQRADVKSAEAGLKYFVLGSFSSAFVLYGIGLLYAAVGSVDYGAIASFFAAGFKLNVMIVAGIALLLVGFAFKVAAVPFHFWSPDVYDGAPAIITAFMSTGPKAAAFVALIRVFGVTLASTSAMWTDVLTWLAILTMTVGNIVALRQTSVKRMLAYSSIAHAGYLLVGIVAGTKAAFAATGYYLAVYAVMNLGAFAVIILLNRQKESGYGYDSFRGMGLAHPLLGITMSIFLLSLTGVPPTAGFFGKLYIFSAAIAQGHLVLAVIGLLNSALGAYYYLRVITLLYMSKVEDESPVAQPVAYRAALVVSSLIIVLVGIFPEQLLQLVTLNLP
jgi:NADH-quinone oxidoreductase subunit N